MPQRSTCPDESVLTSWATGTLQGDALKSTNLHLSSCAECRERLAQHTPLERTLTPQDQLAATVLRSNPDPSESGGIVITEETAGRYQILRELGRGGQSIVYLARDTHLDRDVALKVPRKDARGEVPKEALAQFLREARITARLEHPNIVPIHEIGRRKDGSAYCTQRLIRGRGEGGVRTLSMALRSTKSLEDRLGLLSHLVDVCSAVAHAHLNGVVHRDLKPDNVVIGELGETVVLDWGIAKSRAEKEVSATILGTPMYMSPEQARGELDRVDERSDVFSLGAMLYELLTGTPPHTSQELAKVLDEARRGDVRPVLATERRAPRALAAVVARCLEKDAAKRYSNAAEVGAELRAFLAHRPVRAYSYRTGELIRLFVERHKAVSVIVAISAVLLGALGVATFQNYRRARRYLSEALVEKARASEAALRWDEAAAYYAAARVQADTPAARYGAMLARSRADTHVTRLAGHKGAVKTIAVSPDGQRLASGGFDGTVRLWNPASASAIWAIDLGGGPVSALTFAADGKALFVATEDRKIRRVAIEGQIAAVVHLASELVNDLAVSTDGRQLAVAVEDATVVLIDLNDGTSRAFAGHTNPVYAVAFSPDGTLLASGSWDRTIRLWNLGGDAAPRVLTGNEDSVLSVRFTADGKTLVSGSRDSSIRLWDVATGAMKERLAAHTRKVPGVALSPSSQRLATVSNDRTLRLWSMSPTPRALVGDSLGLDEALTSVAFAGENLLAFGGEDGALYLRSLGPVEAFVSAPGVQTLPAIESIALEGNELFATAVVVERFNTLEVRDARTLSVLNRLNEITVVENQPREYHPAAFLSIGGRLLAGGCGQIDAVYQICLADLFTGLKVLRQIPVQGTPTATALKPDGEELAVGIKDGQVAVFDAKTGTLKRIFKDARTGVFTVAYSPDGKWLATGSYDRILRLYDTSTWSLREISGHEHGIRSVSFSPDSKLIATGGYDRVVRLWDTASGRELAQLKGHQDIIRSVAWSSGGELLASGAWDGTVRLWDVKSGVELARYVANDIRVHSVLFAPDGHALFYGGASVYRVDFPELRAPEAALDDTLAQTGFQLKGSTLVRR